MPPLESGFIRDLCIALAHRWEPERLFVIFTSYFDEAATHGPEPRMTMACVLGNAYEWRRAEIALSNLQDKYGFAIFHAKSFQHGEKSFRGWDRQKRLSLVDDLTELIRTKLAHGITMTMSRSQYLTEYRSPPTPNGMHLDSQYGLCFRACLSGLVMLIGRRGGREHTLHVVIEDGHKNVGDTVRIFKEIKGQVPFLGTITIASKNDPIARPLMIADFLSHSHYMIDAAAISGKGPTYEELASYSILHKYEAGLTFQIFPDGGVAEFKANYARGWQEAKEQKAREWRAIRDARKHASLA